MIIFLAHFLVITFILFLCFLQNDFDMGEVLVFIIICSGISLFIYLLGWASLVVGGYWFGGRI